jgi:hypothetical protein
MIFYSNTGSSRGFDPDLINKLNPTASKIYSKWIKEKPND